MRTYRCVFLDGHRKLHLEAVTVSQDQLISETLRQRLAAHVDWLWADAWLGEHFVCRIARPGPESAHSKMPQLRSEPEP